GSRAGKVIPMPPRSASPSKQRAHVRTRHDRNAEPAVKERGAFVRKSDGDAERGQHLWRFPGTRATCGEENKERRQTRTKAHGRCQCNGPAAQTPRKAVSR